MTDRIEAVADLTEAEARALTDQIRAGWEEIAPFVAVAFNRRAWVALGYDSWDDYCTVELDGMRPALAITARREVVAELADAGMSQRAIGTALGIDHKTAAADLRSRGENSPRESVTGADGKSYPATTPKTTDAPSSVGVGTLSPPAAPNEDDAPARGVEDARIDEAGGEDDLPPLAPEPPASNPDPDPALFGEIEDQETADRRRDQELDGQMEGTATRFRRNVSAKLFVASELWKYDPERIAEVYAADFEHSIGSVLDQMAAWTEKVYAARKRQSSGLRLVAGGRS